MDFLRQQGEPLFPKILWNRPVGSNRAGRLLLVGGHSQEFNAIGNVYAAAQAAEIGECVVVLPDVLQKYLPGDGSRVFVASTPAGSIARSAMDQILHLAKESDAVALGVSLSSNSETAAVAESVLTKTEKPAIIFDEAIDLMKFHPETLVGESRLIIATMPDLFKLAKYLKIGISVTEPSLVGKLNLIRMIATVTKAQFLVYGPELIVVAQNQESVTPWKPVPATVVFGVASVLWLQNQTKQFEGLTTAAYLIAKASQELPEERLSQPELLKVIGKTIRESSDQF